MPSFRYRYIPFNVPANNIQNMGKHTKRKVVKLITLQNVFVSSPIYRSYLLVQYHCSRICQDELLVYLSRNYLMSLRTMKLSHSVQKSLPILDDEHLYLLS